MRKCNKCGNDIAQDSLFCGNCGAQLTEESEETKQLEQPTAQLEPELSDLEEKTPEKPAEEIADVQNTEEQTDIEETAVPPLTPPDDIDNSVSDTHIPESGEWVAPPKPKKSKAKIIGAALIVILLAAIIAGLFFLKPFKKEILDTSLVYNRDDGVYRLITPNSKAPVTICDDFVMDYDYQERIMINAKQDKVAYINDYDELYSVPVKAMPEDSTELANREFRVDTNAEKIFGYDENNDNLYYLNSDADLMLYDGTESTRLDREVSDLIRLGKGEILYTKVIGFDDSASYFDDDDFDFESFLETYDFEGMASSAEISLYYMKIGKKEPEKIKVSNDITGIYDIQISNGKFFYTTPDDENIEAKLHQYNISSGEDIVIATDVSYMYPFEDENQLIYKKTGFAETVDLYLYRNGEEKKIVEEASYISSINSEKQMMSYVKQDVSGQTELYFTTFLGDSQKLLEADQDSYVEIIINESGNALMVYEKNFSMPDTDLENWDFEKMFREGGKLYWAPISDRGVVGELAVIDEDAYILHGRSIGDEFIYSKNPDADGEIVDLYRTDGKTSEEISRDVDLNTIGATYFGNYWATPLFFVKDMDSRRTYGELTMYSGGKTIALADDVYVGAAGQYIGFLPMAYMKENEIYILKDYSDRRGTGDLYVYRGKDKLDLVDYDIENLFELYN